MSEDTYNENKLYNIYKNIYIFINSRKWISFDPIMEYKLFESKIITNNFVIISGVDKKNVKTMIILTKYNSEIANINSNFKQLLNNISSKYDKTVKTLILISDKELSQTNKDYAFNNKYTISSYLYNIFSCDVINAPLVPKHRVLEDNEAEEILKNLYIDKKNMPVILSNDTQAIYCDAKPGDIIEIERISELCGISYYYRLCKLK